MVKFVKYRKKPKIFKKIGKKFENTQKQKYKHIENNEKSKYKTLHL